MGDTVVGGGGTLMFENTMGGGDRKEGKISQSISGHCSIRRWNESDASRGICWRYADDGGTVIYLNPFISVRNFLKNELTIDPIVGRFTCRT